MNFLLASSPVTSQLHQVRRHSVACGAFRLNAPFVMQSTSGLSSFRAPGISADGNGILYAPSRTGSRLSCGSRAVRRGFAVDRPGADKSTLRIGLQDQPGVRSPNMKTLGTEFVLSAEDIKDHYDALGGGLHIPTMAQLQNDRLPDLVVVRARCDEVVSVEHSRCRPFRLAVP